jgi:hypothetical protein
MPKQAAEGLPAGTDINHQRTNDELPDRVIRSVPADRRASELMAHKPALALPAGISSTNGE